MTKILKNLLLFFSIAAMAVYFTSCEKYTFLILPVEPPDYPISYSEEIQPIFDAKCVSCHRGSLAPDLRPENSFKALSEGNFLTPLDEESKLYKTLFKPPHVGMTNAEDNSFILEWLKQGAKEEIEDDL